VRAAQSLNRSDRARSASLRHEDDRRRLAVSRLVLEELVSSLRPTSQMPVIEHPRHRAPRLSAEDSSGDSGGDLHLSLAHSGQWVLGAASPRPVGVDVEALPAPDPMPALVRRHLSPGERAALSALSPPETAQTFLRFWVRKEAAFKTGRLREGIDPGLVDVRSRSVSIPPANCRLQLTDLDLGGGALSAVAGDPDLALEIEYPNAP
jgi:4'-phosphopantetheinyl transferase